MSRHMSPYRRRCSRGTWPTRDAIRMAWYEAWRKARESKRRRGHRLLNFARLCLDARSGEREPLAARLERFKRAKRGPADVEAARAYLSAIRAYLSEV